MRQEARSTEAAVGDNSAILCAEAGHVPGFAGIVTVRGRGGGCIPFVMCERCGALLIGGQWRLPEPVAARGTGGSSGR